ncbi:MAG: oxygen-dependent protoporphyrinogen oxidase [Bathelium mastoideum]|nr:MAG: oxygen-dependent protoporphyrinogen oxidase [Bathelium mastoideum]
MLSKRHGISAVFKHPWRQLRHPTPYPAICQLRLYTADNVAVLGGGITGLATAYHITKEIPTVEVTVYEVAPRIGGWLASKRVDVPGGSVLFEQGPRTLRPVNGSITAQMVCTKAITHASWNANLMFVFASKIQDLGLVNDTIFSSKTSPAALDRYIYYPDHLVKLPAPGTQLGIAQTIASVISEPLLRQNLLPALSEAFKDRRGDDIVDESVGSFLSRRLSPAFANNLVSAMLHGIYGGDVWRLSAKSIFPVLWELERRYGSIISGLISSWNKSERLVRKQDLDIFQVMQNSNLDPKLLTSFRNSAVYTFKDGIGQFIDRLAKRLRENPKVRIKTDTEISGIQWERNHIDVELSDQTKAHHSHIISTISAPALKKLTGDHSNVHFSPQTPRDMRATTVQVVSLYYPDPNLIPYTGFGYLIPQSIPFEQNPERALGVIFDSSYGGVPVQTPGSTSSGGNTSGNTPSDPSFPLSQDTVPGTKLTVMLGGHYWDGYTHYPSEQEALDFAISLLYRHLNITSPPTAYNVALQKDCIPQYTVGHSSLMLARHKQLRDFYDGKLRVAGSWYTGVGVNDCINAAWRVARGLKERFRTGLEEFADEDPWMLVCAECLRKGKVHEMGKSHG